MDDKFPYPRFNRLAQLAQAAFEEMICPFNQYQLFRLCRQCDHLLQLFSRTELIARAAHKQFRLGTLPQKFEVVSARYFAVGSHWPDWSSQTNQCLHSWIGARRAQAHSRAKGKSSEYQRQVRFCGQPVKRGANIIHFSQALIVLSMAESCAAKIEAQYGETEAVQCLHSVKHNLIVQRAAKQRVRMANQRGMSRVFRAAVEQRFKPSRRTVQEERADCGVIGNHKLQIT